MTAPVVLTCGEPAGIGPEISLMAWTALGGSVPFVWLGDPGHLPPGASFEVITDLSEAADATAMPVLAHPIDGMPRPGQPDAATAARARKSFAPSNRRSRG